MKRFMKLKQTLLLGVLLFSAFEANAQMGEGAFTNCAWSPWACQNGPISMNVPPQGWVGCLAVGVCPNAPFNPFQFEKRPTPYDVYTDQNNPLAIYGIPRPGQLWPQWNSPLHSGFAGGPYGNYTFNGDLVEGGPAPISIIPPPPPLPSTYFGEPGGSQNSFQQQNFQFYTGQQGW